MNMLLLKKEDFLSSALARVGGRRLRQLAEIIKAEPGKMLKAGILNGCCGHAELRGINDEFAEVEFFAEHPAPVPAPLTLVIAMQRPQTFMKVLHGAVSLGVKQIHFIHTFKVEKSYWQSSRLTDEAIQEEIDLALEQSADPVAPQLYFHKRFKPFVEDELPAIAGDSVKLFGDPAGTAPVPVKNTAVTLALGPEGGFTDYETEQLKKCGFQGITLGVRILRTEFALAALLGKLIL